MIVRTELEKSNRVMCDSAHGPDLPTPSKRDFALESGMNIFRSVRSAILGTKRNPYKVMLAASTWLTATRKTSLATTCGSCMSPTQSYGIGHCRKFYLAITLRSLLKHTYPNDASDLACHIQ